MLKMNIIYKVTFKLYVLVQMSSAFDIEKDIIKRKYFMIQFHTAHCEAYSY